MSVGGMWSHEGFAPQALRQWSSGWKRWQALTPGSHVGTDPTPQGEAVLDAFHPFGRVKRLRDKPAHLFEGDDSWLRVAQAEKEGLITVRIEVCLSPLVA